VRLSKGDHAFGPQFSSHPAHPKAAEWRPVFLRHGIVLLILDVSMRRRQPMGAALDLADLTIGRMAELLLIDDKSETPGQPPPRC
jgi:hypothetical protein